MKMKKMLAVLLAMTAITANVTALASNAANAKVNAYETAKAEQLATLNAAFADGTITAEEMKNAEESLSNADDDYGAYVSYTEYSNKAKAPTQHYMAVFTNTSVSAGTNLWVFHYLNANVVTDCTNKNKYKYTGLTFSNVQQSTSTVPTSSMIGTQWKVNTNFSAKKLFFQYELPDVASWVIDSEYAWHCKTSLYEEAPSVDISTNNGLVTMKKCIYALGDVTRDGKITIEDTNLLSHYIVKKMNAPAEELDKLALELAADVNQDGVIDILDVVAINKLS